MDHAGFNTYNSLYRARDVFLVEKVIIVSQKSHVIRANYIGKALGLQVAGVYADKTYPYATMNYELREIPARCKAFLDGLFQPKPTYLGEVIPISGSGEATVD